MIDVSEQLSSVRRLAGRRILDGHEVHVVSVEQIYGSPMDDVWNACTNPERLSGWFLPISGDLRTGGHYQLEGNAGGTIERCDPPRGFTASWEFEGVASRIEVRLTARAHRGTRFTLEHIAPFDDRRWADFGPGAVGVGWDLTLIGLAVHLGMGSGLDDGAAWMASEQGRRFVSASSLRWCEANIAAGADETVARAAAVRTTAEYGGSQRPPPG